MNKPLYRHIVLIPVYNDWESLSQTIKDLLEQFSCEGLEPPRLVIVNDGSTLPVSPGLFSGCERNTEVLHLHRNLGHQKAIVIGLSYIHERYHFGKLVIMDADGEDMPSTISDLLRAPSFPDKIILAKRTRRREGLMFRLLYRMYKLFFHILTGKTISFGNFSLLSESHISRLVYYSEIWNNLAGGILKSGIPFTAVPISRGKRHHGQSKMSITALIVHGLNTIAVFIEVISVRILILSFIIIIFSLLSIAVITCIRVFTPYAISGWASLLAASMLVVLLQSFLISLIMIVIYLSSQAQRKFIPARHYKDYLRDVEIPVNE